MTNFLFGLKAETVKKLELKISWRWSHEEEEEDAHRVMFAVIVLWIITPTLALSVARRPLGAFWGKSARVFFCQWLNFLCAASHIWIAECEGRNTCYISAASLSYILGAQPGSLSLARYLRYVTAVPLRKFQPLASSRCTYGFNVHVRLSVIFLENVGRMQSNTLSKVST